MSITIPTDAYCTLAEVQQLLPARKYDAVSKPTFTQAEQIVKDIALEMNAVLRGLGYGIPFDDAEDLAFLKSLNVLGAAAMLESSTLLGVQGKSEVAEMYQARYDAKMKALADGMYKLNSAGTPEVDEADANDDLDTGGDREDPIFSMDESLRKNQF